MRNSFNKISLLAMVVFTLVKTDSVAQQLPLFSQYYYNPFMYNPAFTGTDEMTNTYLIHRSQWKDIPGAPVTYALTIDGNVKEKEIGLGLSLFNDQTSLFSRTGLYGSYSYHLPFSDEHNVYVGLSGGIIDNKIDFNNANVTDVNDPLLYSTNRRKITSDATFGVAYFWKELKVGFSVPQLLGTKINYDENNTNVYMRLRRHFIGSASYSWAINDEFTLVPCIMTRAAKNSPFQFDINANVIWKNMIRGGLSYRFGYAAGMNVGIKLSNNLSAGYAFEYVISPVGPVSGGGHEIMLGYAFKKNDPKKIQDLEMKLQQEADKNDSLAGIMNKKDREHDEEINKLKELMKNSANKDSTTGSNNGDMRKEKAKDYRDENGNQITIGYYVIIESFKVKENAENAKKFYEGKKVYKPVLIYNTERQFYYVSVYFSDDEQTSADVMEVLQAERPDAWVFNMTE